MTESFRELPPAERGEKKQETVEQKREKFSRIVELLTDAKNAMNAKGVLTRKNIPGFTEGNGASTIFLAETNIKKTRFERERNADPFLKTGINTYSNLGVTILDQKPLSYSLRVVDKNDRQLLAEFLALTVDEKKELGVPTSEATRKENVTHETYRKILDTSGQLMEYLRQADGKHNNHIYES